MSLALALALTLLGSPSGERAQPTPEDWPHWRGPSYDGASSVRGLPATFGPSEHVRWSAPLPGPSAATPIVVGERVFLTAAVAGEGALLALCLDRRTGEVRWREAAGSGYRAGGEGEATRRDDRGTYASPSPVCDGERVVFFFGNGDLVAYDLDGKRLWARNVQKEHGDFSFQWTFSSSPTLHGGKLFLQVLQRDEPVGGVGREGAESFLLGLDPASGETLFRHVRPSSAKKESRESYATPIPCALSGRDELLIVGGDVITGHDPSDGKELWRWGTWNADHREEWWRVVPSPVAGGGVALACGPKGAAVVAVRLGGAGTLTDEAVAWRKEGRANPVTTDVPAPLFYQGHFYVLSDLRNALTKLDPASGEVRWTVDLPRDWRWRASPTGADGRVWLMNHHGDVFAIDPADGRVAHRAAFGTEDDDGIRSSLAAAHGALFVRTNERLFCVAAD